MSLHSQPFRFSEGRIPKTLNQVQYRAIVSQEKKLKKVRWNEKKERQRLQSDVVNTYEIFPASTPGLVILHSKTTVREEGESSTWETVPETHLKVELYQVRIAAAAATSANASAFATGSSKLKCSGETIIFKKEEFMLVSPDTNLYFMDIDD